MVRRVATRSQRRTEKKQAVVLLVLVLTVALVSFMFGVMVGRSGSKPAVVAAALQPTRLPVASPAPEVTEMSTPDQPAENLTFYESLPKGGQAPLGSGINLPPAKTPAVVAAPLVEPAKPVARTAGTVGAEVVTSSPTKPDISPPPPPNTAIPVVGSPVTAGGYLVQAASFRSREDARALQAKLGQKGYSAFTEEAHLAEKGVWYRVYVGPFATDTAAAAAVARLKAEEKLTALVRKR